MKLSPYVASSPIHTRSIFMPLGSPAQSTDWPSPSASAAPRYSWSLRTTGMEVDRKTATLLYRAAQELLSNVYKFAQASAVTVRLGCVSHGMSHGVQLKVTDDGGGFDVPAAMVGRHTGLGLRIMRMAVGLAGGEVIIDSSAAGTCVTVTLPLD